MIEAANKRNWSKRNGDWPKAGLAKKAELAKKPNWEALAAGDAGGRNSTVPEFSSLSPGR